MCAVSSGLKHRANGGHSSGYFDIYPTQDLSPRTGFSLTNRIRLAYGEIRRVWDFGCYVLEDYFEETSLPHAVYSIRAALKVLLMMTLSWLITCLVRSPSLKASWFSPTIILITGELTIYLMTFSKLSRVPYSVCSLCGGLIAMVLELLFAAQETILPSVPLYMLLLILFPLSWRVLMAISAIKMIACLTLNFVTFISPSEMGTVNRTTVAHNGAGTIPLDFLHSERLTQNLQCIGILFTILFTSFRLRLRRRAAFLRTIEAFQARNWGKQGISEQFRWIDTIMPSVVSKKYMRLRKQKLGQGKRMWIYSESMDNVSILFADIAGFTQVCAQKSATQVVSLLNDLYRYFDDLCGIVNCEKIGTLGDCYYCVAGCPVPQPNHAEACVEMGLGLCRIMKRFNKSYQERMDLRVGVHTGKVNAAIIGQQRFRYDVYSYDVSIANALANSGLPGRVHISEATYTLVKHVYEVAAGPGLDVKQEIRSGIAGMVLGRTRIKSFFVNPRSSVLYNAPVEKSITLFQRLKARRKLESIDDFSHSIVDFEDGGTVDEGVMNTSFSTEQYRSIWRSDQLRTPVGIEDKTKLYRPLLTIINEMREQQEGLMKISDQLSPYSGTRLFQLWFTELSDRFSINENEGPICMDSLEYSYMFDVFGTVAMCLFTLMVSWLSVLESDIAHLGFRLFSIAEVICEAVILTLVIWYTEHPISPKCLQGKLRLISLGLAKECTLFLLTSIPTIRLVFWLQFTVNQKYSNRLVSRLVLDLQVLVTCIHILPATSSAIVRSLGCLLTLITLRLLLNWTGKIVAEEFVELEELQWFPILWMVYFITRLNHHSCRHGFRAFREALSARLRADEEEKEARDLLHNIVPPYVLNRVMLLCKDPVKEPWTYAVSLPNAGVMFASVSNFFSTYYREDYKGGESALVLLNAIISSFDGLLSRPTMVEVEKIKTMNDCYMAASGLNPNKLAETADSKTHLVALMDFCFLMIDAMEEFNANYIVGSENFELKIGYNCGAVTAGIIGIRKPFYDVWGDTVNVASRMHMTAKPGIVQVPSHVYDLLKAQYEFESLGEVFVRGKGLIHTYSCTQKRYT
ncbi:Adenylate cyclase type 9 [Clonorchis sinensis]|uniref:adenylate cyclase n=1 Tax=Clonorchis sinensis TaxID=79923 RepID=A0A3R7CLL4_CLOSI|nr:Adenylate cyclase type 9 [Clonorchis sinensis]